MTSIIANITTKHYVVYNGEDNEFKKILKELFTKMAPIFRYSFWNPEDKIVFVPKHLELHVMKYYGQVIVFPYKKPVNHPATPIKEELMKTVFRPDRVCYYLDKYNYFIIDDLYNAFE
jgi:hypothetical protein